MQKNMPNLGAVLIAAVIAVWVGGFVTSAFPKKPPPGPVAPVPETGQTTPFAPGDDGAIQAGVPWPVPRFTDQGEGTVRDNLTGLIWLKDASCVGSGTWTSALGAVANLNVGTDFGCENYSAGTFADWRLPNIRELQSLIDFGTFNPALPAGHPFSGGQSIIYWSSTTYAFTQVNAWVVDVVDGSTNDDAKSATNRVWPVRGGQ